MDSWERLYREEGETLAFFLSEEFRKDFDMTKEEQARRMTIEEVEKQARQDVRNHKYHNLIPGQKSPQEFNNSERFWNDIFEDYPDMNTGLLRRKYREAWVAEYQKEYDAYFNGGD